MRHTVGQRAACALILSAGLAVLLVAGLIVALAGRASAQYSPPAQAMPSAGPEAAPAYYGKPGVITWTFDTGHQGWWTWHTVWNQDPWAGGAIHEKVTNRSSSLTGWVDRAEFEAIHDNVPAQSWLLAGDAGTLSFMHAKTGAIGALQYSVCLTSTGPDPYHPIFANKPYNALCTAWRAMTPGAVNLPLVADGLWRLFYIETQFFPPYTGTPVTQTLLTDILKDVHDIIIYYSAAGDLCPAPRTDCLKEGEITVDNVRLELIGAEAEIGASTRYAADGDAVLFYAAVKGNDGQPLRASSEITMSISGRSGALRLYDEAGVDDLNPGDGVYSRWVNLNGTGTRRASLYYRGVKLASVDVVMTAHPQLIALTDIRALYQEFLHTGTPIGQDDDNDGEIDFYQMLGRIADYAARYKGLVYDVRANIDPAHGFDVSYADLAFAGDDPATNRFRMAKLIDEALTAMHRGSAHTISDVAIIGADDVIPFYRIRDTSGARIRLEAGIDTPTATDLAAGFVLTDVPYGTVDYLNQEAVPRPSPQIPVGRVTAAIPMGMIERLDGYDAPIVLAPAQSHATLFILPDDAIRWSWLDENLWTPIFTGHYRVGDMVAAPVTAPGYYRYTGYYAWGPEGVLDELKLSDLTVLATRGNNRCDDTALPRELCGSDYKALPRAGGKLYVIPASLSGFSPAFYSPTGSRGSFNAAIPRWLQSVHRTEVGSTWLNWGSSSSVAGSDYLFAHFVAAALDAGNTTVGDAFVRAWDGYWTAPSSRTAYARSVSYGMILWGPPTQPIRHGAVAGLEALAGFSPDADRSLEDAMPSRSWMDGVDCCGLEPDAGSLTAPALDRSFTVEIDVPNFQVDADATGALLVRPANGGATYAEGPDLPLLPQVVKRFILPPDASDIQVAEEAAARVTQAFGPARLQTAQLHVDCAGECTIRGEAAAAAAGDYPSQAFDTDIQGRGDGTVLTLAAVPALYSSAGELTLFTKMKFTVAYKLPAAPAVSITGLIVNNGQAVRAGTAAVPLTVNVTSATAQPITLTWTVVDPSGLSLGGGLATANVPAGFSQVKLTMDATRWTPGPKTLSVSAADASVVLDALSAPIQVLGLRIEADLGSTRVQIGKPVPLTVRAWDENGAASGGLAARLIVRVDGTAQGITFTEGPAGHYSGTLSTAGLALGGHQAAVLATDSRNLSAEAWTGFEIARLTYLPLVRR